MRNLSDFQNNFESKSAQENLNAYLRHELRTPLNAIIGYSEMLLEDAQEDNNDLLIEQLQEIEGGGRKLLSTVNLLLPSTSVSAFDLSLNFQHIVNSLSVELSPTIERVLVKTQVLLKDSDNITLNPDLEKIDKAAQLFHEMLQNINGIIDNYFANFLPNETEPEKRVPENISEPLPAHSINQGNILVVDDNVNNLDLLTRYLTRLGHKVTTALSAEEALEKLAVEEYDLILLDLIMPKINGYQLLVQLKADKKMQHIPIIMISALDEIKSVVRCIEVGAEDYLPKPFDPILLKARIDSCLEKKRLRDAEQRYLQILNKELEKGREIQKNFLPDSLLSKDGWDLEAFFRPARQMAGDFYDVFELGEEQIGLVIADVCDKGVGAALFMGLFRSLIRIFSGQTFLEGLKIVDTQALPIETSSLSVTPSHIHALAAIGMTNNYIAYNHGDMGMFATVFFGVLDLPSGELSYVNGGHEPLFIIDSQGKIKAKLSSTGPAVGMLPDLSFKVKQAKLEVGDVLFGYTDGVPEARTTSGAFFTDKKLLSLLQQPFASANALIEIISLEVLTHIDTADQFDDITMLAVRRVYLPNSN